MMDMSTFKIMVRRKFEDDLESSPDITIGELFYHTFKRHMPKLAKCMEDLLNLGFPAPHAIAIVIKNIDNTFSKNDHNAIVNAAKEEIGKMAREGMEK